MILKDHEVKKPSIKTKTLKFTNYGTSTITTQRFRRTRSYRKN